MYYNRYYIRTHTHFTSNGQVICYAHSPLSAFRTFLAAVAAATAKASPTRASAEYKLESKQKGTDMYACMCVDGRNEKDSEEYTHTHMQKQTAHNMVPAGDGHGRLFVLFVRLSNTAPPPGPAYWGRISVTSATPQEQLAVSCTCIDIH